MAGGLKKKDKIKWTDELAEQLHKPVRHNFERRRVYVEGIDNTWAADLVDMSNLSRYNGGVKFLLAVIDVFSKYGWLIPLKDKTGKGVAQELKKIFESRKPKKLWVDKGLEFYNQWVQNIIPLYSTENEEKSMVVERWNRTMKEKMYKYFTANNTRRYIDVLPELVKSYNKTIHSSTGMTPVEASKKQNEDLVRMRLYPLLKPARKPKLKVGDTVRIMRKKGTFEKGYTPRWTEELFKIMSIQYTNPVTYKIAGLDGEDIKGSFYEPELQKSTQDTFRIERVIRKRGNKSLVKWLGYPESFNSWVDTESIINLKT